MKSKNEPWTIWYQLDIMAEELVQKIMEEEDKKFLDYISSL